MTATASGWSATATACAWVVLSSDWPRLFVDINSLDSVTDAFSLLGTSIVSF